MSRGELISEYSMVQSIKSNDTDLRNQNVTFNQIQTTNGLSFEIYSDRNSQRTLTSERNTGIKHMALRNLDLKNRKSGAFNCRVVSDTVLFKRSVSSDNEKYNTSIRTQGKEMTAKKVSALNKLEDFKQLPIARPTCLHSNLRPPLAIISTTLPSVCVKNPTTATLLIPSNTQEVLEANKENIAPTTDFVINSEKKVFSCEGEDQTMLFAPSHYWNLIFSFGKAPGQTSNPPVLPLELFHMLLYDYEHLWEHIDSLPISFT